MSSINEQQLDLIKKKGEELASTIIEHIGLKHRNSRSEKDDLIYETLSYCVNDILQKHVILFNGMVNRIEIHSYNDFSSVANELFEGNNESSQLRITWGRIIALFAFAVRLSQEYSQDQKRVKDIIQFLTSYLTKHVLTFVRDNGGWKNLVEQFPSSNRKSRCSFNDEQLKKALIWSGLCVGLAATTMYITSFLR